MVDMNKQALDIWNAIKPMIDKEIENKTRGMVQRRKAKVTTAPNGSVIGVTEAFGTEIFVPYVSSMANAQVGDVVWIEFMYGATNAFASMYASADSKDVIVGGVLDVMQRRCSATLSSAGWYRVFLYSSTNDDELAGSKSANIRITITREGIVGNSFRNEVHFIDFSLAYGSYIFSNETSVTQSFAIDKIRYGYDLTNHFGFIDIHCKRNDSNPITVSFNVATDLETQREMASVEPYSVADAPSGETVVTTYTFNKNNGNPLVFKSQYYASVSLYNASGSFVNELRWQENEDDSIWILSGYATLTVTERNGSNPGLTINLPSTFNGQSALYRVGSQTQYQKEHLYLQLTNGSSTCTLRTSESWNNLATGEVRFYVYQTIIFNR